ncbi:Bax inhibitor-1 family protein, partial [Escherichia coli]|nr:Bax inhibitor-1 family protein [Escherichia coli]
VMFFLWPSYLGAPPQGMSFPRGLQWGGIGGVVVGLVDNFFLPLPALHLAISAVFILISSGAILFETSNIIHGGETNYIRATVSPEVSRFNHFVTLLGILGFAAPGSSPPPPF